MNKKNCLSALLIGLFLYGLAPAAHLVAQAPQAGDGFLKDYSNGPGWFPNLISPYKPHPIPPISMESSPRLRSLIHDGKLELSLADALALAIENNLDI